MSEQHKLRYSPIAYPGGLRIVECEICSYAFAAEVNEQGIIQPGTKVPINYGDTNASHAYFHNPRVEPELRISAHAGHDY